MSNLSDRITVDPDICHGQPTIRGMRYPVEMILELLSGGMTIEELLADYEDLEREDILAVIATTDPPIPRVPPLLLVGEGVRG